MLQIRVLPPEPSSQGESMELDLAFKICGKCRKQLPLTAFDRRRRDSEARQFYCHNCDQERHKLWRKDNPKWKTALAATRAKTMSQIKVLLAEAKNRPCMDCGRSFPAWVMDLDHRRGEKVANLARLSRLGSIRLVVLEILKCDPVCARCHRLRTANDGFDYSRYPRAQRTRQGTIRIRVPAFDETSTRVCQKCGVRQLIEAFRPRRRDQRYTTCLVCQQEYQREWSQEPGRKVKRHQQKRKRLLANSDYIMRLKETTPCSDCGELNLACAVDFDHLRDKSGIISRMVNRGICLSRLLTEVSKCEIVCANCHRERTYARRSNRPPKMVLS